jgi:hypothetical protein
VELTRDELWLLEVTVLNSLPISLLFSYRFFLEELNLPFPDSRVQRIVAGIRSLCNRGLMVYEVCDGDYETQPSDIQGLESRLEKFLKGNPPHDFDESSEAFEEYYSACGFASITPAGGEAWERFAEPDWGQVILRSCWCDGERTLHRLLALEKTTILGALSQSGEEIIEETAEWEEHRPWPWAWKVFDSAWALRTELRVVVSDPLMLLKNRQCYVGNRRWYKNSVIFHR